MLNRRTPCRTLPGEERESIKHNKKREPHRPEVDSMVRWGQKDPRHILFRAYVDAESKNTLSNTAGAPRRVSVRDRKGTTLF